MHNSLPPSLRKQVLERDNYCCIKCSEKRISTLEIDHIIPKSISHNNALENLQTLCKNCHHIKTRGDIQQIRTPSSSFVKNKGELIEFYNVLNNPLTKDRLPHFKSKTGYTIYIFKPHHKLNPPDCPTCNNTRKVPCICITTSTEPECEICGFKCCFCLDTKEQECGDCMI